MIVTYKEWHQKKEKRSDRMDYLFDTEEQEKQVRLRDLLKEKPILFVLLRHIG